MRSIGAALGAGLGLLFGGAEIAAAAEKERPVSAVLKVGDGRDWKFVNSRWRDTESGGIAGERIGDGDGLQGYCLAFAKGPAYSDLEATFSIRMNANHADQGLIVRAQDPTHYYLLHFPQTGQQYRAQHFWAALSVADGSGYLRVKKVALVPRVASNPFGIVHQARVKVTGDRFQVWVNGHAALDVRDSTYHQGRVGLSGFMSFAHEKVVIHGDKVQAGPWDESMGQVKNWFHPFPDAGGGQFVSSLIRAANGDLLCTFMTKGNSTFKGSVPHLGRSTDGGKTWKIGSAPKNLHPENLPGGASLTRLPDGRLVSLSLTHGKGARAESKDHGRTWTTPEPIEPATPWPADPKQIVTGYQLGLKDGTLVRFAYGLHSTSTDPVTKWGAVHCQAFATHSTDEGKTWSSPSSLDATGRKDMGNLDLTEPVGFETRDGKIMCLIRPIYSPWMWETWSSDKGKTWSPCVPGPFPGWAPSAPVKTASGVVLFPTRFPGLTLHHTRDDGMTWDQGAGGTYIDTSIWAMGSLLEVEPNVVLFIYMDNSFGKLRAQFIRVTEKGLEPMRN